MAIFDHTDPKIIESTCNFSEFVTVNKKNHFIPSVPFWNKAYFKVPWQDKHFLIGYKLLWVCINMQKISLFHLFNLSPETNQKLSNQVFLWICINTINKAVSSNCFREIVVLKILQSDWRRAFWLISHEKGFSKITNLCTDNINFHYWTNSVQIDKKTFL